MRLAFVGTAAFAVPSLQALLAAGHEAALVATQPDRPGHRLKVIPAPVKAAAQELRLEITQPEKISAKASVERLREVAPELIVVVAYGQIIPRSILELPSRGVLNVHGSLLPRWRGAAPVARAILAGDRVTGVTIMQMDQLLDHGAILARRECEIGAHEDALALTERLAVLGADLLVETLPHLDQIQAREQDHSAATLAPKLTREEGELTWQLGADEIDRKVRAFRPWPGVTLPFANARIKVLSGRPQHGSGAPGDVLAASGEGVEVACGSGSYLLREVQLPGRRAMPAAVLVAGRA